MKETQPIGMFDSGVGGLSVLREVQSLLPRESFIFLADQAHAPYGEKNKLELVNLALRITDHLAKNYKIKMLVIACNTATCYVIEELRKKYKFPIVGTVPAVKLASEKSRTKSIGVISTPATAQSAMLKKLIRIHTKGVKVCNMGCPNLENGIEHGNLGEALIVAMLQKYLRKIKNSKADHLVLGCTHYPFLEKKILEVMGRKIKIIHGAGGIAKRVKDLLKDMQTLSTNRSRGRTTYLTTGDASKFARVAGLLLKKRVRAQKIRI